jgi:peptidoglycan biosynthesis protein MviN/MurJ (putative lipid II flippase)
MASLVGLIASAVVALAALLAPMGGPRLTGLVLALLAGEMASAIAALVRVRAAIRPERMLDRRHLVTLIAASCAMAPLLVAGWWLVGRLDVSRILELPLLIGCGLAALIPYGLVLLARGLRPAR